MRQYLFDQWQAMAPKLKESHIVLFLDYDGTLTPIAARPKLAKLSSRARKTLKALSNEKEISLALISGRALVDLKKLVGVPGIVYAGNHGFEIEGPKMKRVHPGALAVTKILAKISARLKKVYPSFEGILVENKKFSLSVHYRELDVKDVALAKKLLLKEIKPYLRKSQVVMTEGKKVWEIRPAIEWDKGKTVMWLLARAFVKKGKKRTLPIYIGDDQTDEDAFEALKHKGLTIRVVENKRKSTKANYYLSSPHEAIEFLDKLKELKATRIRFAK